MMQGKGCESGVLPGRLDTLTAMSRKRKASLDIDCNIPLLRACAQGSDDPSDSWLLGALP